MLLKWCIIWTVYLLLVSIEGWKPKNLAESEWSISLVNYISSYSKKHQVVFIIEDDIKSEVSKVQELVRSITRRTPSFCMTFQETINSSRRYRVLENNPRSTTIFVLIPAAKKEFLSSRLSGPIEFLISLASEKSRPKCLIIQVSKERPSTYEQLLQDLWKKQFLDATLLEIVEKKEKDDSQAILHHFNPFNTVYTRKNYTSDSQWFPEKTHNLHGSGIKSFFLEGELMNPVPMMNTMSKLMNFSSNLVAVNEVQYGKKTCGRNGWTGQRKQLLHNKINFDATVEFGFASCKQAPFLKKHVMLGTINAVVPRIVLQRLSISASWECFYTLLITTIVISALQILPPNCKFQKSFWRPLHMLQVVLGMSVPDPTRMKDKIIFGSVLLTCIIFSGYLFTMLTDISLYVGTELEINIMEQLNQSNFIPVFHPDVYRLTQDIDILHLQELRKKARFYSKTYTISMCLNDAILHKNVSCIMLMMRAKLLIPKLKGDVNQIKLMEQPVVYGTYYWMTEPGSVYFDRFNQIIQGLVENGVMDHWGLYGPKGRNFNEIDLQESGESMKLRYQLLSIIVVGYLLSLIVFIGEILVDCITKKKKRS